ncbi:PQQ-binding-like beta-propeller repeat protein [Cellulomonas cellasea]|uniref:Outer membrane protein assembly factor BamB n=1 Tax=Cellulomonas cellasea TaxID=43670 RepID=A0A7W4UJG7_9CELL|nr:PQQ-binding-like beta-propeller repeat protein [Cellulomonas cellasea]MBB2925303.1 outer membrane protein assembly factor BamB [Cellulomonas cellasea]
MGREPSIEVELVEEGPDASGGPASDPPACDAPSSDPEASDPGASAATPSPRRRVRARTVVAAGVALAAGLVGTQAVLDARERALYARYADVPGVVAPLSPDLEVLWRADQAEVALLWADHEVGGLRLGAWFDDAGTPTAVALDPRTGERAWAVPLGKPEPVVRSESGPVWVPCDLVEEGTALLVCLVPSAHRPAEPGELLDGPLPDDRPLVADRAELVVLDAATGEVVRRAPDEVGTGMAVLGDLVVTARVRDDDSIVLRGSDARSGDVAWTTGTEPGTAAGDRATVLGTGAPQLGRVGDAVLVQVGAGGARVDADGRVVATYHPTAEDVGTVRVTRAGYDVREGAGTTEDERAGTVESEVSDGTLVTSARGHVLRHGLGGGTTYLLRDGGTRTALPGGFPLQVGLDDGSEPDLLLVPDDTRGVDAWDTRTGRTRWSRPDLPLSDGVVLDGRLYVATVDTGVVAVDLSDGTTVWSTARTPRTPRFAALTNPQLLTDGRVLAVVGQQPGGAPTMQAYALADGRPLWAAGLPAGVATAHALGGHVVGLNGVDDDWSVLG